MLKTKGYLAVLKYVHVYEQLAVRLEATLSKLYVHCDSTHIISILLQHREDMRQAQ